MEQVHPRKRLVSVAAGILAVSFGMQWVLLHVVVLGVTALTDNPNTSFSGSTLNHEDCQVCSFLNEKQEKTGGSQLSITPKMVQIEPHRTLVLGPKDFFLTEILMLYDPNWCANPFQLLKPPKVTA